MEIPRKFVDLLNDSHTVNCCIIGASLSEPHTSESNGGFFIYIYIYYPSYVVP